MEVNSSGPVHKDGLTIIKEPGDYTIINAGRPGYDTLKVRRADGGHLVANSSYFESVTAPGKQGYTFRSPEMVIIDNT